MKKDSLEQEISALVEEFIEGIVSLVNQNAYKKIDDAIKNAAGASAPLVRKPRKIGKKPGPKKGGGGGGGGKRLGRPPKVKTEDAAVANEPKIKRGPGRPKKQPAADQATPPSEPSVPVDSQAAYDAERNQRIALIAARAKAAKEAELAAAAAKAIKPVRSIKVVQAANVDPVVAETPVTETAISDENDANDDQPRHLKSVPNVTGTDDFNAMP